MANHLELALKYEVECDWVHAAENYYKAAEQEPDNQELLLQLGGCLLKSGHKEQAGEVLVQCYQNSQNATLKTKALEQILSGLYNPNQAAFRANYEKNISRLAAYEHNFCAENPLFGALPLYLIPISDTKFYVFDKPTGRFFTLNLEQPNNIDFSDCKKRCVVLVNIHNPQLLIELTGITKLDPEFAEIGLKIPIYLIWEEPIFRYIYLQIFDYCSLIDHGNLVFFDSWGVDQAFGNFVMDPQAFPPEKYFVLGDKTVEIGEALSEILKLRNQELKRGVTENQEYYRSYNRENIAQKMHNNPMSLRIMFFTSIYSYFNNDCTRDFYQACREQDIPCYLLIDKSYIHRANIIHAINEFKPDIIFRINHFREQYNDIPNGVSFVTWLQDPIDMMYSGKSAQYFIQHPSDYVLCYSKTWIDGMIKIGYPPGSLGYQAVPINEKIFFPRHPALDKKEFYSSDVAICSNFYHKDPEKLLLNWIIDNHKNIPDKIQQRMFTMLCIRTYDQLQRLVQKGILIASRRQCEEIIAGIRARIPLQSSQDYLDRLTENAYLWLGDGLHRKNVVGRLIDAGINLKIWGKQWDETEFASYNPGWVPYGEELAEIYSSAKIVIGSFALTTGHYRIYGATACGALCIVRYVPSEFDHCDIRDYLTPGKHFIFYENEDDLIAKIRYYLTHEDERREIVANGQKRILEVLTYSAAVRNFLEQLKNAFIQQ